MNQKKQRAITLVEMSVAMVVFSIIAVGTSKTLFMAQTSFQRQDVSNNKIRNLQWALTFIRNSLRYSSSDDINVQNSGNRINFSLDTDGDYVPDSQFWYWRGDDATEGSASTIYRGSGASFIIANNNRKELANLIVSNPSGNPIFNEAGDILEIEITVRPDPDSVASVENSDFTLRSMVRPLNCTHSLTDEGNCGWCGNQCLAADTCCSGVCSNLNTDEGNCGSCGGQCSSGDTCCSGACSNLNTDEGNCGSCGSQCSSGDTCCSGVCRNLNTDEGNCGSCGSQCGSGYTCCSGGCRNLSTDGGNCGSCGHQCQAGSHCRSGGCGYWCGPYGTNWCATP